MSIKDKLPAGTLLGFGTAPLGNMFRAIPEHEAIATVEAAWDQGIRFFDTAPFYGAGLAEIRLGEALSGRKRDDYVLATKVGRLVLDERVDHAQEFGEKGAVFQHGRKNKVITRQMQAMVDDLNAKALPAIKELDEDRPPVTCAMCHAGSGHPKKDVALAPNATPPAR